MKQRNELSQLVIVYKKNPSDVTFQPIYDYVEPKISTVVRRRAQQLSMHEAEIRELLMDGLLLALKGYNPEKAEFSTYMYTWFGGKLSNAMQRINRDKNKVNLTAVSIFGVNDDGKESLLPIASNELTPDKAMLEDKDPEEAAGYLRAHDCINSLINKMS